MNSTMIASIDDIAKQARQGSVAAIIQVLNEKLASSGVRTRAVLVEGVLQILCEARSEEPLEQSTLVDRIRDILEFLAPKNIRQVNINSRLVREQQLLWLEEITRDPKHELLWSEKITLSKPNIIQRLLEDMHTHQTEPRKLLSSLSTSSAAAKQKREQRQLLSAVTIAAGCVLLMGFGGGWYWYQGQGRQQLQTQGQSTSQVGADPTPAPTPDYTKNFAQAVRLAEEASAKGKKAETSEEWLAIASLWDRASQLMASVPANHPRYETAKNRTALYGKYSQSTQKKAESLKQQGW